MKHPTKHLFRVIGKENPITGSKLLEHIFVVHETEIPNEETVSYIKKRNWILTVKFLDELPELQNTFDSVSREIIDHYKLLIKDSRPIHPIVLDEDGLVLEGWYRTIAAKESNTLIGAYIPLN